jgi:predicted transcriptional regulator
MAKLTEEKFKEFAEQGFFDEWKSIEKVVEFLSKKGFSIKGTKVGMVSRMLTKLCQKDVLERDKDENKKWKYRKDQNG